MGHVSHAAIVKRLSNTTYPGFEEFRRYFDSYRWRFPRFPPGVFVKGDAVWFGDNSKWTSTSASDPHDLDDDGEAQIAAVETVRALNSPDFRALWNLLPAGTDAFVAFIQIYMLNDCPIDDLDGHPGTYTIRVASYLTILEHQVETPIFQANQKHLSVLQPSWGATEVTVCL
ncbi:hypothetical protein ACTPOK_09600 [Streptomyces inhibens]|uniref:hypothetical protein n=1 Tax=Streptomyces inhibens TaxID=2293571 RepID=UPI00402A7EAF